MRAIGNFTIETWDANGREVGVETGTPLGGAFIVRDLTGPDITGRAEVLFAGAFSEEHGSGTYVAIDAFDGELLGRTGTCNFWHVNTMTRGRSGADDGILRIVPDSGTGGLTGITGSGEIRVVNGEHSLVLDIAFTDDDAAFDAEVVAESAGELEEPR
ncbi:hypothetical protein GCM10011490_18730 [Pseudoclavibacter endophyticus]|uniref:DUF3224 domain-containing protein n=1 Tax=Pseudoclavibacter endophyticus TaxID=1778590 RepID=A0A6H9WP40_9MICO|nr:DUF3224 domain-containing protein [Pseudoclavibacter endophyticus]KAB1648787.1 DUF3224 domain-containing protein [Pseudoclavibacter endophyticus]GGA68505.1 hypothetical protein GCM10011490_18730 [Pseudoclavibacter endophyticus]